SGAAGVVPNGLLVSANASRSPFASSTSSPRPTKWINMTHANAVRMVASAAGGLVAIYWLDLGGAGLFTAGAAGFSLYRGGLSGDEVDALPVGRRAAAR